MAFGEAIGRNVRGGEVFELVGDLGGGKTAFVSGVARALGLFHEVSSPSFTISNVYKSEKLTVYHYDFYRLDKPGVVREELAESLEDPKGVVFIEWGKSVADILPEDRIKISILPTSDESRRFTCEFPERLMYVFGRIGT